MTDATLQELKIVVERAVRPVRATLARKRRMREEFLGHLTAIFLEEVQRLGDETVALNRARERFGDPQELSARIQQTVPRREWFSSLVEGLLLYRQGERVLTHAARVAALMFGWFSISLVLLPFILLSRGRAQEIVAMECFFFWESVIFAGLFFVMTLLGHGVRGSLFRDASVRRLPLAVLYSLLSAFVVPVAGFALIWAPTGDLALASAYAAFVGWLAPVVPVVLVAAVWEIAADARQDAPWMSLPIDL